MAFQGFGSYAGPLRPPTSPLQFGEAARPPNTSPSPPLINSPQLQSPTPVGVAPPQRSLPRPNFSHNVWQNDSTKSNNVYTYQRPSTTNITSNSGATTQGKIPGFHETGSPVLVQKKRDSVGNTNMTSHTGLLNDPRKLSPPKSRSPPKSTSPPSFINNHSSQNHSIKVQRLATFNSAQDARPRSPVSYADLPHLQESSLISPSVMAHNLPSEMPLKPSPRQGSTHFPSSRPFVGSNVHVSSNPFPRPTSFNPAQDSRPRSPVSYADLPNLQDSSLISASGLAYNSPSEMPVKTSPGQASIHFPSSRPFVGNNTQTSPNPFQRPSASSPVAPVSRTSSYNPHSQAREVIPPPATSESQTLIIKRPSLSKRSRSPSAPSREKELQEMSYPSHNDSERETQAKARRKARFKIELNEEEPKSFDSPIQKLPGNKPVNSEVEKIMPFKDHSDEGAGQNPNDNGVSDYDGMESSGVIVGLCPDMCPEKERAERERKGDLDQYERLDGDRNQTDKFLAVKKYTRTAEREAVLIRPMPILQKTINYLITLLDKPYDDRFLGMYNFLWDRMRAIRLDLRMQHIFNHDAILMLEQMIRLHIIAMHELCEYTKGEGFSEGFDAHLNIEQMNKTSVELFQMYDDHKKKGIEVPTEKEFRGYYALLKLDKHPGYKVEPAELSLDLSKMTPEIRQSPEVLFARAVARACRTGNFIAFFRLARKATYLQACLMHAHFAKLRTQALASLHSGLMNGQGIPVSQVSQWLGLEMEEDDIESLLDFHGFAVKDFDEPFMVKEGSFFNSDKDYATKLSFLVHSKRSRSVSDDIRSSSTSSQIPNEERKGLQSSLKSEDRSPVTKLLKKNSLPRVDVSMLDQDPAPAQKVVLSPPPLNETSDVTQQFANSNWVPSPSIPTWSLIPVITSPPAKPCNMETPRLEPLHKESPEKGMYIPPSPPSPKLKMMPVQLAELRVVQEMPAEDITFGEEKLETVYDIGNFETQNLNNDYQMVEVNEFTLVHYDKEVAKAKLKLILRMWKRRTSKMKELREKRVLAANAALHSLSLGSPIRINKNVPSTSPKFNINHIMRERYKKLEKFWSPLNVSEVVADPLCQRNPEASCLCYKIIMCSQISDLKSGQNKVTGQTTSGSWLLSKLIPDGKGDDNLLLSSSGISIWRKWICSRPGSEAICCVSVIKDSCFEGSAEEVTGANAVLFLFSKGISLELQQARLKNLWMSLPSGSQLPLLILSDYKEDVPDPSASVVDKLNLGNVDKSRISAVHVVFLSGKRQQEPSNMFYSDEQLRLGLQWIASESPLQPVVHSTRTRDLVLGLLRSSLDELTGMSIYEVTPQLCLAAFNRALDKSIEEVVKAARLNHTGWPCPEIGLLDEYCDERRICELYLPQVGWSSPQKIEDLVGALNNCKVPVLIEDLTWLHKGSFMGEDIENHRSKLEELLAGYLTNSIKVMGFQMATKEASLILQKNIRLELHNSNFFLIPDWAAIYQRIFNWQLMNLTSREHSTAYISEQQDVALPSSTKDVFMLEASLSSPCCLDNPTLDEMVGVIHTVPAVHQRHVVTAQATGQVQLCDVRDSIQDRTAQVQVFRPPEDERDSIQNTERDAQSSDVHFSRVLPDTSSEFEAVAKKEANRLSELLNSCNIVQNNIGKKLSPYF